MAVRGYQLALDWFRQGTYGGVYDDVTSDVDDDEVQVSYGRDQSTATSRGVAGKLSFSLNNRGRLYSYENTASPLAGRFVPGTPTRYQVSSEDSIYTLFDGVLDEVTSDPGSAARTVSGEALDVWAQLGDQKLSTPVYRGVRTGDAIGLVLDAIGWTGGRDVDPGATVLPWWWEEDTDAATAVDRLIAAEGPPAVAYVQGGVFVYRDRHHRLTRATSTTSQGVFTHIEPAGTGPAGDYKIEKGSVSYDHGLKNIANSVTFTVDQRTADDVTEVWSSEDTLAVDSGQTVAVFARTDDPFINAVTPDVSVLSGTVSVSLSRTSGQSVILSVTATGGPAVVTRLAFRANPIVVSRTVKVVVEDQASISMFGRRTWPGEHGLSGAEDARAVAQRIVATYGQPRPTVVFSIPYVRGGPIPVRYLRQMLQRQVSDRITVRIDPLGINQDFTIEKITHRIRKHGLIHRVEFGCQVVDPAQPSNVLTFDVAGRGFNQGAFGVDGIDNPSTMFRFDVPGQGFNQGVFAS